MKQKILLIAVAILSISGVYAQKVTVENGKMIIDASALKLHTSIPKSRTTNATMNTLCTNDLTDIASMESDAKVYKKFEICKTHIGGAGSLAAYNWIDAVKLCADLVDEGTGWRLPTRRELTLIKILEKEIKQHTFNGFSNIAGNLWSASQTSNNGSIASVGFSGSNDLGTLISNPKYRKLQVRCIREIAEPEAKK